MAAEGGDAVAFPQANPTIKSTFSTLRYSKAIKRFNPIQIGHIHSHNLGNLLNVPHHLMIPKSLLLWLVRHMSSDGSGVFSHKNKQIQFNKNIVDKIFGFPSSSVPYNIGSDDPAIVSEVNSISILFEKGKCFPITHIESIMLGTNDETIFMRSFIWFFISSILCPSTLNLADPKFLFSLRDNDIMHVGILDFATLCLNHLFSEINDWSDKVLLHSLDHNKFSWIGGCLPLLAIGYLDFVQFNGNPGNIDYHIPRMSFIRNEDFKFLERVDCENNSDRDYGVLPLRDISLTPYGDPLFILGPEAELGNNNELIAGGNEHAVEGDEAVEGDDAVEGHDTVEGDEAVEGDDAVEGHDVVEGDEPVEGDDTVEGNDAVLHEENFQVDAEAQPDILLLAAVGNEDGNGNEIMILY